MGHGHFDKLSWQLYDNGQEIVRDYGAARFLNIEAKQAVATFPRTRAGPSRPSRTRARGRPAQPLGGDVRLADTIAPQQVYFSAAPGLQVSSGRVTGAYPGVTMTRTLVMADIPGLEEPTVIDLVSADSAAAHTYDLPLHYQGHLMEIGFPVASNAASRPVLGADDATSTSGSMPRPLRPLVTPH